MKEWLKGLPSEGADAVDCGSLTLDKPQIAAIEKALHDMQVHCTFGVNVKCEMLLCCLIDFLQGIKFCGLSIDHRPFKSLLIGPLYVVCPLCVCTVYFQRQKAAPAKPIKLRVKPSALFKVCTQAT